MKYMANLINNREMKPQSSAQNPFLNFANLQDTVSPYNFVTTISFEQMYAPL